MFSQLPGSYFLPGVMDFLLVYIGARPQADWNKDRLIEAKYCNGFFLSNTYVLCAGHQTFIETPFPWNSMGLGAILSGGFINTPLICVQCSCILDLTDVIFLNSLCWMWWLIVNKCNNVTTCRMPTPPLCHVCLHDLSDTCRPFGINKISSKFWQHSNLQWESCCSRLSGMALNPLRRRKCLWAAVRTRKIPSPRLDCGSSLVTICLMDEEVRTIIQTETCICQSPQTYQITIH